MTKNAIDAFAPKTDTQSKLIFLRRPQSYPEHRLRVDMIETHMAWVFLTDRHAYKLKKPIHNDFLDYSSVEARHRECREEVRLNRRLAGNVYISVVALAADAHGNLQLNGEGVAADWLVKMQRLPAERMLDYALRNGTADDTEIRRCAQRLAEFYRTAQPLPISQREYWSRLKHETEADCAALEAPEFGLPVDTIVTIRESQLKLLQQEPQLFDQRIKNQKIIEGHGDLRPAHVCLLPQPVIIDCLAFNRLFRIVDPIDELAFLAVECELLGAPFVGDLIFAVYRDSTGDELPQRLLKFYKCRRACLRAKLSIWHLRDCDVRTQQRWRDRARAYLNIAHCHSSHV